LANPQAQGRRLPLSAACAYLFSIFVAVLHPQPKAVPLLWW